MATIMITCLSLATIVFSGCGSNNFPLDGCSTDDMDVLSLYFDSGGEEPLSIQNISFFGFVEHLISFPHNKTTPRVQFAHVYDRFTSHNPDVNVSSWHFQSTYTPLPYGYDEQQYMKQVYKNAREAIEVKIQFVQRLFSAMSGVRENVTHVAVIFLGGEDFSYEERRSVPHIVGQHKTDIRIFVVVMGDESGTDYVLLSDALLAPCYTLSMHTLVMAICSQCKEDWFMFEHSDSFPFLSCYKLLDFSANINGYLAWGICYMEQQSSLVAIETKEELIFIQNSMYLYFEKLSRRAGNSNVSSQFSAQVHIGLGKDSLSGTQRFIWNLVYPPRYWPVIVNNWLPGKPSAGNIFKCAVWEFFWHDHVSGANITRNESSFKDGWTDVSCDVEISSLSVCETVLPRRFEPKNIMRIKAASNESFSQALSNGNFITFDNNIVSVSAKIASNNFLQLLKEADIDLFPVFDCGVGASFRYLSYVFVCDSINHCSNKRDEALCGKRSYDVITETATPCKGVYCCDGSCLPLMWVNDGEVDCTICEYSTKNILTDESAVLHAFLWGNKTCDFICNVDQCLQLSQLNDGHADCTGPEGPLDETLGKLQTADTCHNILGHRIWAPKCVYVRDRYGGVLGCRDMSHLNDCTNIDCPEGYFKCVNAYCIPQHYIHDGKVDCPTGEDEQPDIIGPCFGNFACWKSKICLHPSLVCNGHLDCPQGDDEADCRKECSEGVRCVSGTITVVDYNMSNPLIYLFPIDSNARYIDLSGIDLSQSSLVFIMYLSKVAVIIWSNCKMRSLPSSVSPFLTTVQDLDISYNLMQTLDGRDIGRHSLENVRRLNLSYNKEFIFVKYLQLDLLETLDLSHTAVSDIDASFVVGLPNLKHLDLSFTHITCLNRNIFPSNLILQFLDIRGLTVVNFSEDFFNSLTVSQHLYTDSFELCCPQIRGPNILSPICHSPDIAISSCFDLIGVNIQRVLIWAVAVVAVLGNMAVIVYRLIWDRSALRTGYGLFVTNLGISDFIMGLFMFIIAMADYYYRGVYILFDKIWREGITCRFAGFLATLSSETSTFFILLITLDRFLVMKFPFGQVKFSRLSKMIALLLSWITGLLIALFPVVFSFEMYSSSAICLGLPFTTNRLKGWEYSVGVCIVLNFVLCLFIAYGQRAVFRAMSENRISGTALSTSSRRADLIVAKQLSLIALSNSLCWFPVGVIGLLSLGGYAISNDVYAWAAVTVLPINSAANPLLYTIPVLMNKWNKLKYGKTMTTQPKPKASTVITKDMVTSWT